MNNRTGATPQPLRSMGMNAYALQQNSRQPRLQNSQKTGLGNGSAGAGWAFGAPSSGGPFGLGGRPGLSGFAQVMGGGSGQGPIDMSEFPSLSGPQRPQQSATGWNSNVIRQQPAQQPQLSTQGSSQVTPPQPPQQRAPSTAPSHHSLDQFDGQRSQQPSIDRGGGGDEFPPLGGQLLGADSLRQPNTFGSAFGSTLASPDDAQSPVLSGLQTRLPIRDTAAQQAPIGSTQSTTSQTQPQTQPPADSLKPWGDMSDQEQYGMLGLAKMFEALKSKETGAPLDPTAPHWMNNVDMFAGHDLSSFGMDLDSSEPIHPTFHVFPDYNSMPSAFNNKSRQVVPEFTLPAAYKVNNVPQMHTRMSAFSDETLLAIFYQFPRDVMQELAAQELSQREWRWHKVLRQWLQKDTREANQASMPVIDLTNGAPLGAAPTFDGKRERGIFIFFDHQNWRRERREFILDWDQLDQRGNGPFTTTPQVNSTAAGLASAAVAAGFPQSGQPGGADRQPGST